MLPRTFYLKEYASRAAQWADARKAMAADERPPMKRLAAA